MGHAAVSTQPGCMGQTVPELDAGSVSRLCRPPQGLELLQGLPAARCTRSCKQGKLTSASVNRSIIAARAKVACMLLAPRAAAVVRVVCADGARSPVLKGKLVPGDVSIVPGHAMALQSRTGCRVEQRHSRTHSSVCGWCS